MNDARVNYDTLTDKQRERVNGLLVKSIATQIDLTKERNMWPTYMNPTEEMVTHALETLKIQKVWHRVLVLYASANSVCVYVWQRESDKRAFKTYVMICSRNREKREASLRAAMEAFSA